MAIDILSRGAQTPIVVGDRTDMKSYRRCSVETVGEAHFIILSNGMENDAGDHDELRCAISANTGASFLMNEFVLLVALSNDDQIAHAIQTPINDLESPVRDLTEPEVKQLAELLVAGDFQLDFLR